MRLIPLLVILLLSVGDPVVAADEWLQSEELATMVSGKTAVCKHLSRPSQGRTFFDSDGTMHGVRRGEPRSGTWYVEGDTLCTNWGKRPICSRYQSDGTGGHYKFTLKGKKVVHIQQWLSGDRVYADAESSRD